MLDGTKTADPTEQETAIETEGDDETELQAEQAQPGEAGDETEQAVQPEPNPDEFDEIELEGAKHRIPKALKGAFLMHQDYTRKTQEVAEQRKAFESERETFAKSIEAEKAHVKDLGHLHVLDEALGQYEKVDWAALRAQDPDKANAAFQDYMQLRDNRQRVAGKIETAKQEFAKAQVEQSDKAQREFATRYQETNAVLARDIKGWNQEAANKVRDFAIGSGVTPDELRVVATTPHLAKIVHLAWLGSELTKKQQAAAKAAVARKPAGETEVKPLQTVARRPAQAPKPGLHDDLDTGEWIKRRNEQLRNR